MKHQFIEDNLVILSKQTIDAFLSADYPDDLIALYVFYYYTAKWQRTNCIKATRKFVRKGLKWGSDRFTRANKKLIMLGLVEPVIRKDKAGKVIGHYVRLKYIWKHEKLVLHSKKPDDSKQNCGKTRKKTTVPKNQTLDLSTGGKQATNALSVNNKSALSVDREMLMSEAIRLSEYLLQKIIHRKSDFKKPNIKKWAVHIDRMIRLDKRKVDTVLKVIDWCQQDDFWQDNILSTDKLRKQFDKLELGMQKNDNRKSTPTSQPKHENYAAQESRQGIIIDE